MSFKTAMFLNRTALKGIRLGALRNVDVDACCRHQFLKSENVNRYLSTTRSITQNTTSDPVKWLFLLIPGTTFGLGTWQVHRRNWKRQLIADLKERTNTSPCDLPYDLEELKNMEYRPVRVEGHFDHSREFYMGPRSLLVDGDAVSQGSLASSKSGVQSGYLVVTPFHITNRNQRILVNRGWVPTKQKNPNTRNNGQIEGEVEIVGIVRLDEKRAPFTPQNKADTWFYRDLQKMADIAGTEPVFLEAVANTTVPGGPVGGQTRVSLRDEHLSYMFTWFGLSAATAFMWYQFFVAKKRIR